MEEVWKIYFEVIFSHSRKLFSKFPLKIFLIILRDIIYLENFCCLSAHPNPELRSVICTGVALFALMLHLNCTVLDQSELSNFFMYIISILLSISCLQKI